MRNKNLMWEILKKNDMMNGNTELMELVMNVTGTLIFDDKGEIQFIGPQANHRGTYPGTDVWRTGYYLWLYIHGGLPQDTQPHSDGQPEQQPESACAEHDKEYL